MSGRLFPVLIAAVVTCLGTAAADRLSTASSTLVAVNDPSEMVWCHNEALAIVKRKSRARCSDSVIDEEQALRIKQQRVQRVKRAMQRELEVPGMRLHGTGTGFFISSRGELLTNHHVIAQCATITVTPVDGETRIATLRDADPAVDLALLEIGQPTTGAGIFRRDTPPVTGERVTIIGYPLHGKVVIKPMAVSGHVRRSMLTNARAVFEMKIDVRSGNSGGPVLDESGRVIGVVFAGINTPAVYARTGQRVEDLALGIGLPIVRHFLTQRGVSMIEHDNTGTMTRDELLERGESFIAQVGCWN